MTMTLAFRSLVAFLPVVAFSGCGNDSAGGPGSTGPATTKSGSSGVGAPDFTTETTLKMVDTTSLEIKAGGAYMPTVAVDGLVMVDPIRYFTPANLAELINGEAESYVTFDVKTLASAEYGPRGGSDEQRITVHIYDMGTSLRAFGRYALHKNDEYRYETLGTSGFSGGSNVIFYQGQWLVELSAGTDEGDVEKNLMALAGAIQAKLPAADGDELSVFEKFPEGGKPNTEAWAPENMANHEGFGAGYWKRYDIGGKEAVAFVRIEESPGAATAAFSEISAALEVAPTTAAVGEQGASFATKYHAKVVLFRKGSLVAGVSDVENVPAALEFARKFAESL